MKQAFKEFPEGCLWEDAGSWTLITNCEFQGDEQPCKHCHSPETKEFKRYDGTTWSEKFWHCPFVVMAKNEGGHNSTGICLDCIIEATKGNEEIWTLSM